ncbi:hypothetical protein KIPB_012191 [Kipferlia bialata]|uniref:Uncharacterized protein n=1 Tax=Kipferlia bialata TaxID=797122 RepID=A0A391NXI3_9EUKA|nr:hypothetical protein KIPB_012191 [Kipferlia bialata]|eukprot:g12191.t1
MSKGDATDIGAEIAAAISKLQTSSMTVHPMTREMQREMERHGPKMFGYRGEGSVTVTRIPGGYVVYHSRTGSAVIFTLPS